VAQELTHWTPKPGNDSGFDNLIKSAFLRLDDEIINDGLQALRESSQAQALARLAPANAGSCALLAVYDPTTYLLRIACVGDSRAVLGRAVPPLPDSSSGDTSMEWSTEILSKDQTGFNDTELSRLANEHPGEGNIVDPKTGRLLGIMVTRAFGDNRWKWPAEDIAENQKHFFGPAIRPNYASPPYMTAEPVITTTEIRKGDFLILASDGLWDFMSSEQAVECVALWIHEKRRTGRNKTIAPTNCDANSLDTSKVGRDQFLSSDVSWKVDPKSFIVEDENAATHLVRNAYGGSQREVFRTFMSLQPPVSRNVRDDTTVQVIFFGDILG
jgi:pyruvate dehydrogenase phosphatase